MRIYPFRTTTEQIEKHTAEVTEAGDTVVSGHYCGGRDWVLICRSGEPTILDLTVPEFIEVVAKAVKKALDAVSVVSVLRGARAGSRAGARR